MKKILLINGPNLNMLGIREPEIYGNENLASIEKSFCDYAKTLGYDAECFQSNHEGAIIDKIHEAYNKFSGIVINPGAYTHYSYAIRDAIGAVVLPAVEVHISDINKREDFRKISVTAPVCIKQMSGYGTKGYLMAIDVLCSHLEGIKNA